LTCCGGYDGLENLANQERMRKNRRMLNSSRVAFSLVVGMAVAAGGPFKTGGRTALAQPQTCGLLTTDEVQALAPQQDVTNAEVSPNQGSGAVTCRYMWGTGNEHFTLALSVQPASRMFAGMSADAIKQHMLKSVTPETSDESIPDVGEAAVFKGASSVYVTASAYVKDRVLLVTLDGIDAADRKAQLIALLKSAASRL
jgi:hypothetical protein